MSDEDLAASAPDAVRDVIDVPAQRTSVLEGVQEPSRTVDTMREGNAADCSTDTVRRALSQRNVAKRIATKDKSVQTFFAFMRNLTDRQIVEIVNTPVDHEDRFLVFYR